MNSEEIKNVLEYRDRIKRNNILISELEATIGILRNANSIMDSIIAETINQNGDE